MTGDAELMTYIPSIDVIDATQSEPFLTLHQLAALTEQQAIVFKQVADNELPHRPVSRQAVVENCSGVSGACHCEVGGEGDCGGEVEDGC